MRNKDCGLLIVLVFALSAPSFNVAANHNAAWVDDLTPITLANWNYERAAHLLERAFRRGFTTSAWAALTRTRGSNRGDSIC